MMSNKDHEKYISYFKDISSLTTVDIPNQQNAISGKKLKEKFRNVFNVKYEEDIEKAIMNSELGLSPQNDGENIIINIPALTEERRMILAKQIKSEGEKGKISVRSVRKESNEYLKKLSSEGVSEDTIKDGENEVQKITDQKINKIDEIINKKEEEIKTI